ncbi:nicotinamidase [Biomphalaria glabrata]|nr:nicotinamidase [Biomphalaria glabrata]
MVPALVIIDVQKCFLKGGNLAVTDGDAVINVINRIRTTWREVFKLVVLTKDWHCQHHVSFASSHEDYSPFSDITLRYNSQGQLCDDEGTNVPGTVTCSLDETTKAVEQKLWPDHCIANVTTGGASSEIAEGLVTTRTDIFVLKGDNCQRDSYSAVWDNGNFSVTKLPEILKSNHVTTVYLVGLALDYCVFETAMDIKQLGYETYVVRDATRAVAEDTGMSAVSTMRSAGVKVIMTADLNGLLSSRTETSFSRNSQATPSPVILLLSVSLIMAATLKL